MNDVVFVMTDSKLGKKKAGSRNAHIDIDDLESDDDWVAAEDAGTDDLDEHIEVGEETEGASGSAPNGEDEFDLSDDADDGGDVDADVDPDADAEVDAFDQDDELSDLELDYRHAARINDILE